MKLTIEEANKFKHLHSALEKMTEEGWDITKIVCRSFGFIEGWNQAIETIEKNFLSSIKPFDLNDLEKLKVKGEK